MGGGVKGKRRILNMGQRVVAFYGHHQDMARKEREVHLLWYSFFPSR